MQKVTKDEFYDTERKVFQPTKDDFPQPSAEPKLLLENLRKSSELILNQDEWDLERIDVENDIHCDIFSELSGLTSKDIETIDDDGDFRSFDMKTTDPNPYYYSAGNKFRNTNPTQDHTYSAFPKELRVENVEASSSESAIGCTDTVHQLEFIRSCKYQERRKKNNLASRKSREMRKRKYNETAEHLSHLEMMNAELRGKVAKMEHMCLALKKYFSDRNLETFDLVK